MLIVVGLLIVSIVFVRVLKQFHKKPRDNKFNRKDGPRKSQRF